MHRVFYPLTPLVFVLTFFLPACSGPDEPPGEYRVCCDDGEPAGGGCPADSCPENESVAEAQSRLSVSASAVYTITAQNAPASPANCNDPNVNTWCECGTDYTNAAPRCNTASEVLMMRVPAIGCEVSTATLSYTVSTWAGAASVSVRRILRPVTDPTMGVAGLCATGAMASWHRSGPEAWSAPGALADDDDRTADGVAKNYPGNTGERTESFDVTALVGGDCVGGCVLAQYATGAHVQVYPGTVSLVYECAGPPAVCGDGAIEGAEGCDDGDAEAGDGCSAACAVEAGFACSGEPSTCATSCGDGVVAGLEECDDGNTTSADGCSSSCASEVCTCQ